jgi:hypothetical protein
VTDRGALVVPTVIVPKLTVLGEVVTGALPVPLSVTVCGLFPALSVNVSVPVAEPIADGVNVRPTVHRPFAATLVPQVLLLIAKPDVVTTLVMLSATL